MSAIVLAGIERREAVGDELLLEIAGRIAERRRGAGEHGRRDSRPAGGAAWSAPPCRPSSGRPAPAAPAPDCAMVNSTSSASASKLIASTGVARAVARQVERDRLIAGRREARDLRRERARAAADAVQEDDRGHSGFPSRRGAAGSPSVCISRFAQANIATAWVRSRISRSLRPCARSGAASAAVDRGRIARQLRRIIEDRLAARIERGIDAVGLDALHHLRLLGELGEALAHAPRRNRRSR